MNSFRNIPKASLPAPSPKGEWETPSPIGGCRYEAFRKYRIYFKKHTLSFQP